MKTYVALMFCKADDLRAYGAEVLKAIQSVAGQRFKYAEGSAHLVAIGFATDKANAAITAAFSHLWQEDRQVWVLPLASVVLLRGSLMEWARKQDA
jgi:hypothetical protein